MRFTLFAVLAGMTFGCAAPAVAETAALVAHRAVYELSLDKSDGSRAPTAVRGLIAYEFSGSACDGYTTNFRQMLEIASDEGSVHVTDLRSSTFEDSDFKNFRFHVKTSNDGRPGDDVDGNATRASDGALSIRLSRPKLAKMDFSSGIAFPTEHIENIIAAAKAGQTTLTRQVYDGSETGEKLFDTLTVIGKPNKGGGTSAVAQDPALKDTTFWPVSISYFEVGKDSDAPSYVLAFDLYENGVSRALKLNYGDFSLKGEMTSFEVKKAEPCLK